MKDFTEQDQRIVRELNRYGLAPPSAELHERVLLAAREAMANGDAELHWIGRWRRACRAFQQEILAVASALMLILGAGMQLRGNQSVLADSMERLAVMVAVSGSLYRAVSMDCTVIKPGAGDESSQYRVRWDAAGVTRVDMNSTKGKDKTLWISKGAVLVADNCGEVRSMAISAMPSKWQPPTEFLTPSLLARRIEGYGLTQAERQRDSKPGELQFAGQENPQVIEMSVDAKTGLPIRLNRYLPDSSRMGKNRVLLEEVRFQWNTPIPRELFVPDSPEAKHPVH